MHQLPYLGLNGAFGFGPLVVTEDGNSYLLYHVIGVEEEFVVIMYRQLEGGFALVGE